MSEPVVMQRVYRVERRNGRYFIDEVTRDSERKESVRVIDSFQQRGDAEMVASSLQTAYEWGRTDGVQAYKYHHAIAPFRVEELLAWSPEEILAKEG